MLTIIFIVVKECNGAVGELERLGGLVRVQRPSYKIVEELNEKYTNTTTSTLLIYAYLLIAPIRL